MRRIVPLVPLGFGAGAHELDVSVGDSPVILVADPDIWQSHWTLLGTIQRTASILFDGCSLADLRSLLRSRELPPPFPAGVRPLWLRTPEGEVSRATLANG
jgi:S-DNA-T family DNA segregation ATPase FtsK/SpoIIIE